MAVSKEKILEKKLEKIIDDIKSNGDNLRVLITYKNISYGDNSTEKRFVGEFIIKLMIEPDHKSNLSLKKRKELINSLIDVFKEYNSDIYSRVIEDWGIRDFGVCISFDKLISNGENTESKFELLKRILDSILKDKKTETFKKEINTIIEYK